MSTVQHVFKRGSVYWWRRRLPNGATSRALLLVEISLRTKSLETAKILAAEITLTSEHLLMELRLSMIDADDARRILMFVAKRHSALLDGLAGARISYGDDPESNRLKDTVVGWVTRIFGAQGDQAKVGPHEENEMRLAGLDDQTIARVAERLSDYRELGIFPTPRHKLKEVLDEFNLPEHAHNLRQVEQLYLRGLSAAFFNSSRRWTGIRPDDEILLRTALASDAEAVPPQKIVKQSEPVRFMTNPETFGKSFRSTSRADSREDNQAANSEAPTASRKDSTGIFEPDQQRHLPKTIKNFHARGLFNIVFQASQENVALGVWQPDMLKQHVSIAKLFVKFLGHEDTARMRQSDISEFRSMLFKLPKTYGKSSKDDSLSMKEILDAGKQLPQSKVGRSTSTVNRYMTQLNNIITMCKSAGYPFGNFEGVGGLRVKKKGGERNERGKFTNDDITAILSLPVWHGSLEEGKRLAAGPLVFHDSVYWMPLLAAYTGSRREEIAGLLLVEVEIDCPAPCIRIEHNEIRRLKNEESIRRVPMHPELLRLGFDQYVKTLRAIGHRLLFPELKAAAVSTPMGDVFDEDWRRIRDAALPNAASEKKVFHSFRHWCINEMKQAEVPEEVRKDIVGHKVQGENGGRYSDAARLHIMAKALAKLPQPSVLIQPYPIRLLERVESHKAPPAKGRRR